MRYFRCRSWAVRPNNHSFNGNSVRVRYSLLHNLGQFSLLRKRLLHNTDAVHPGSSVKQVGWRIAGNEIERCTSLVGGLLGAGVGRVGGDGLLPGYIATPDRYGRGIIQCR